ncbi:MAG: hypothetical protein Q9201_004715 [Fulgogasparrea decipioides]
MRNLERDTLTEQQGNNGNHCKYQHWQSNCFNSARFGRLGDPETDEGSDGRRLLALTEHSSQANVGSKGNWLLENSDFKKWYSSSGSAVLWLSGIPGSGKTTLVNTVQAEIESRMGKTKPTVYFYLQYEGASEDPAKVVLKSLVNKICALDTTLKDGVQEQRLASLVEHKCPPADSLALCHLFRSLLDFVSPEVESFFLIDSLDEYPWIIDALLSATTARAQDVPPIRISKHLVSYRSSCKALNHYVEDTIAFGKGFKVDLDENAAAKTSLTRYIEIEEGRLIDTHPECELRIRRMIRFVQQRSASSFLWAKLALESISQHLVSGLELDTLDLRLLPLTLGEIYQQRLDLALSKNGTMVVETLRWVLYAARPLSALELNGALLKSSSISFNGYSDSFLSSAGSDGLGAALTSICGGLLQISENRRLVLAHRTVREYLCDPNTMDYQSDLDFGYIQCHESLAMTSLQCLITYRRAQNNKDYKYSDTNSQKSFREYAYDHWMKHYWIAEAQSLQLTGLLYEYLLCLPSCEQKIYGWQERSEFRHSMLLICAMSGFTQLCKVVLQMGTPVDIQYGFNPVTPLHLAVSSGHPDTVRLLLEYGADKEATTSSGETALFLAVRNADRDIVKLLLDFGADIEARIPETNEYPLHVAAANGAESVISLVCFNHPETDEDVCGITERPVEQNHPPCRDVCCEFGSLKANLPCKCCNCQLDSATEHEKNDNLCDEFRVSYLEARSNLEWTPLHYAAAYGHDNVIRLLLRLGAHNDVQTKEGESALVLALKNGHTGVMNLLQRFSKSAASASSKEAKAQRGQ